MKKKKTNKRKSRKLVLGFLEKISSEIFSDYSKDLTNLVGRTHGVYALYKGSRLYYVGLATNLRNRIKIHLRDRHAGKWDKFSLYLIRKADHIKEIESLMLRIADPTGNATKGRLRHAENLKQELQNNIKKTQTEELNKLIGSRLSRKKTKKVSKKSKKSNAEKQVTLAPYVKQRFIIRATYKGNIYKARVRSNGLIYYDGKLFSSPSQAGRAVIKSRTPNGWNFWNYKNKKGEWMRLNNLRK